MSEPPTATELVALAKRLPALLSAAVAEVRAELGRQDITNGELARRLGVSEMWVSRRLRGRTAITVDELDDIAAALGVPVSRFLSTPSERERAS